MDRRTLLRSAAVGGTLLWAAPVVQTFGPVAQAGTAAPSLSWVAVLLRVGTKYYRLKFNAGTLTPTLEQGGTWTPGGCKSDGRYAKNPEFYKGGAGLPQGGTLATTPVPSTVLTHYDIYTKDGGFYLVLAKGVEFYDWAVHKGQCCAYKKPGTSSTAVCQSNTGGTYKIQFVQYVTDGARSGNQWLFPAGPNNSTCNKLGNSPYTGACGPSMGTPK